jgi:hypothetical protein
MFKNNGYDLSTPDINDISKSELTIYVEVPKKVPKKSNILKSYLILLESEVIHPSNLNLNIHKYFNKVFTWNDKLVDNKKYFKINFSHLFPQSINKDLSKKEKLCVLIAGHKSSRHPLELYSKRIEAIRWFERNHLKDFSLYGSGWDEYRPNNRYLNFILRESGLARIFKSSFPSYQGKIDYKKNALERHKFSICYENARDIDGYITEKIFDCFFAGCIPVYWGANNILDHIPKNCFIDKRDFPTYNMLYQHMISMSDEQYMEYLNNIEFYLTSKNSYEYTSDYFANTISGVILNDAESA